MSDYNQVLKGIPGNIVVFKKLEDFFEKNDVSLVKEKFLATNECPRYHQDSWLWYIYKYMHQQNINDTEIYLQNLMSMSN
jgi:hypothetical protein